MRKRALQYWAQKNHDSALMRLMPVSKKQVRFCRAQHRCSHIAAALWHEIYTETCIPDEAATIKAGAMP